MKTKKHLLKLALLIFSFGLVSCSLDDDSAGVPINSNPTTFEIIAASEDHTILEDLLLSTGLNEALNQGTFTVFAPTDSAFNSVDTSGLSDEDVVNLLLNHVVEGSAESSDLETSYINTLATESVTEDQNALSLYVNVGETVTLNGMSTVNGPDNMASNGVVHVVDEVITIPDVTTFATADPTFESLVQALTREDQPNFAEILSSSEAPAPFTVFAPTNEAFVALLGDLGAESLADIDGEALTSVLNTHVIGGANITSSNLPAGTVETLGASFELDGETATITDQDGREINIIVTDVQAGNGVMHAVDLVISPGLGLGVNTVGINVDHSGASAYFVTEINGDEEVTELNSDNSTWTLTVGTRYELTVNNSSSHPFQLRNAENDVLLSMASEGSFHDDPDVNFVTEGDEFHFTLTPELADEIDNYICNFHPGMNGDIEVNL